MVKNAVCCSEASLRLLTPSLSDCGDVTDIQTQTNITDDSECNISCSGDPVHLCGGGLRLTTYFLNETRNVWHTPENTGYYEVSVQLLCYFWSDDLLVLR